MTAKMPILDEAFAAFVLGYTLSLVAVGLICWSSDLQWSWLSYEFVEHKPTDVAIGASMILLIGIAGAAGIACGKKWGFVISQALLIIALLGMVSAVFKLVTRRLVAADALVIAFFAVALVGNFYFVRRQPGNA